MPRTVEERAIVLAEIKEQRKNSKALDERVEIIEKLLFVDDIQEFITKANSIIDRIKIIEKELGL